MMILILNLLAYADQKYAKIEFNLHLNTHTAHI